MTENIDVIKNSLLFDGVAEENIAPMLKCLSARLRNYAKNDFIMHSGERADSIGMVLSGSVLVMREDYLGNRGIIANVASGGIFAESWACTQGAALDVSVAAAEPALIMFLDIQRVLSVCTSACEFHLRIVRNLISVLAEKNLNFSGKLTHIAWRSIRGKVLSYLHSLAKYGGADEFDIPFNRQELADYLFVDRSALSAELAKMRAEGILEFRKNRFKLKAAPQMYNCGRTE